MGRPGRIDTLAQDMGVHYFYLAVGLFFLLPGIFGPQRVGLIRHVLENRVVQLLGLISYGLYLWNETLLEKYIEWTDSTPFNTSFLRMLAVVFVATVLVEPGQMVTPGTPPERVDLLQKTLAEIIRDPAFVAETKKLTLSANHAGADEVRATVEQAMTLLDKAGLAEIRQIALDRYYQ